jgi:hypothetical protein
MGRGLEAVSAIMVMDGVPNAILETREISEGNSCVVHGEVYLKRYG